jgi:hypothetical protein
MFVIELSDVDGIEFAPFPIPPISAAVTQTVLGGCQNPFGQVGILISGDFFWLNGLTKLWKATKSVLGRKC